MYEFKECDKWQPKWMSVLGDGTWDLSLMSWWLMESFNANKRKKWITESEREENHPSRNDNYYHHSNSALSAMARCSIGKRERERQRERLYCSVNMMGSSKFKSQCIEIIWTMYKQFSMHIVHSTLKHIMAHSVWWYAVLLDPIHVVSSLCLSRCLTFLCLNEIFQFEIVMNAECRPRMGWCQ